MRPLAWILGFTLGASVLGAELPEADKLPANPDLPDPLVLFNGQRVTTKNQWQNQRRAELKELFQHYMYGYLPPAPKIDWKVEREDTEYFGGKATKKAVSISFGPPECPRINLLLVIPNKRSKPAPVFVGVNFCGNHTLVKDPAIPLPLTWIYNSCPGCKDNRATEAGRGGQVDVWNLEQVIDRGYAVATFYNGDIDPDKEKPDFSDGVHPHFMKPGQTQRGLHDWGTIAAWAWGVHRVVDYLCTDKDIDKTRIAVVGHSRLGKTALVAAAFDERIALAIPHQAGCGGTAPSRGKIGESVKKINDRFPHWFNDAFKQFNDMPDRLPFDQHCLVALVAPRPVLFTNAVEDTWANPDGQFEVLQAADPVYRLLGAGGLDAKKIPELGKLSDGTLGYFIRPGKHSMTKEDWQVFLAFADKHFGKSGNPKPETETRMQQFKQIVKGMTKKQVEAIAGYPDVIGSSGATKTEFYVFGLTPKSEFQLASCKVIFDQDRRVSRVHIHDHGLRVLWMTGVLARFMCICR